MRIFCFFFNAFSYFITFHIYMCIYIYFYTAQMPEKYRKMKSKPRGVSNRIRALEWIKANATDGVLYFADDDNTYDVDIFTEVNNNSLLSLNKAFISSSFIYLCPVNVFGKRFEGNWY